MDMAWEIIGLQATSGEYTASIYPDPENGFMWIIKVDILHADGVRTSHGYAPTLQQAKDDATAKIKTDAEGM